MNFDLYKILGRRGSLNISELAIFLFSMNLLGCQMESTESSIPDGESLSGNATDSNLSSNHTDFLLGEVVSPSVKAANADLNPTQIQLLNDASIDPEGDGFVNDSLLQTTAQNNFGSNFSGTIVLDWEGPGLNQLKINLGSASQIAQVAEFAKAIRLVRAVCPKAKIGYYALPMRYYYNRNSGWKSINDTLAPIIAESDALFPSIYDFYEDGVDVSVQADTDYVKENIQEAIRISQGKPVYPFVWPRFHPSNARIANRSIGSVEFRRQIVNALTATFNGRKAGGIVWWGADFYWAGLAATEFDVSNSYYPYSIAMRTAFAFDKGADENYTQYVDRIHQRVFNDFREAFRSLGLHP